MKISQLAKRTGISARSVRHYEKKGLITGSRLQNNYREFDDSVVEVINTIQLYLNLGLTTDEIKDILYCKHPENQEHEKKGVYCEELMLLYEAKLEEVNRQRTALANAQLRLEDQINMMKKYRDQNG
ncbi:MerR family transcriptional regulator [Aneurinibacillus sp. REN35]|uniref:MerR family transcriptional regulator n=1 Tax=Aneurinibacillus sp. REN35 TaxID=3237286 RepID=UPI003527971A